MKITIFGLAATGKSTVSKIICKDLGLEYMSTGNIFRETARLKGLSIYEFDSLCKNDSKYDLELDDSVKYYGDCRDNFVFESRLAWYFIPDSIKIKLDCDLDERIRRVVERDAGNFEEAKKLTLQRENDTLQRYSNLYGLSDYMEDKNFDFIIDTTYIGIDEVVNKIKSIIKNSK